MKTFKSTDESKPISRRIPYILALTWAAALSSCGIVDGTLRGLAQNGCAGTTLRPEIIHPHPSRIEGFCEIEVQEAIILPYLNTWKVDIIGNDAYGARRFLLPNDTHFQATFVLSNLPVEEADQALLVYERDPTPVVGKNEYIMERYLEEFSGQAVLVLTSGKDGQVIRRYFRRLDGWLGIYEARIPHLKYGEEETIDLFRAIETIMNLTRLKSAGTKG